MLNSDKKCAKVEYVGPKSWERHSDPHMREKREDHL